MIHESLVETILRSGKVSGIELAEKGVTALLVGLTPNDPRSPQVKALLQAHFDDARKTASATDALRSTFVTACLAPTFLGIGL